MDEFQQAFGEQPQQQAEQPAQEPTKLEQELFAAPEQKPAEQPQQPAQQPAQPAQPAQPQQSEAPQDPYASVGGVGTIREQFEKKLEEKYPIKGVLDINKIDKKDPNALAQFLTDVQNASRDDIRNEQLREQARQEFEQQVFEPVYQVYPKLRQDPTTDNLVRMLYRGAAQSNPNVSPVQVATAFSNFVRNLHAAAVKSAQANMQNIPSKPAGNQGRATSRVLNTDVVEKMAGGGIDDVAKLVGALQGKGVGGL